jgi:RimJ/RimL family protein N-acetyltransferase
MNFLLRKGLTPIVLYTAEQNIASATLLRKLGFNVFHHWKFMRKTLPEKTQIENLETRFQHDSENITSDGKILKR